MFKFLIGFVGFVFGNNVPIYDESRDAMAILFEKYLKDYNKAYIPELIDLRFNIFDENVKAINKHNKLYLESENKELLYYFDINQFTDWSYDEFRGYNKYDATGFGKEKTLTYVTEHPMNDKWNVNALPESIDWSTVNPAVVTPVKNQGNCGSCWAFGATGSWESRWALATGTLNSLSEQELIDCVPTENCELGGFSDAAFSWGIQNGGDALEKDYSYVGRDGSCKKSNYKQYNPLESVFIIQRDNETAMMVGLQSGPITVAVDAAGWSPYKGGIFNGKCGTNLDHNVIVVGYGQDSSGNKYWKIKNSWGASWGENGYIRICRDCGKNGNEGECGINKSPSYPIVKANATQINIYS